MVLGFVIFGDDLPADLSIGLTFGLPSMSLLFLLTCVVTTLDLRAVGELSTFLGDFRFVIFSIGGYEAIVPSPKRHVETD